MVGLLYEALRESLVKARVAIQNKDIPGKGQAIGRAVRLLEEGLKAGLNDAQGGELAANLRSLYDYCIVLLSEANLHTDPARVAEVEKLIAPLADAWEQIRGQIAAKPDALAASEV